MDTETPKENNKVEVSTNALTDNDKTPLDALTAERTRQQGEPQPQVDYEGKYNELKRTNEIADLLSKSSFKKESYSALTEFLQSDKRSIPLKQQLARLESIFQDNIKNVTDAKIPSSDSFTDIINGNVDTTSPPKLSEDDKYLNLAKKHFII